MPEIPYFLNSYRKCIQLFLCSKDWWKFLKISCIFQIKLHVTNILILHKLYMANKFVRTDINKVIKAVCIHCSFSPSRPTFEELKKVVAMVITAYPRQALWTMMAISKSSYQQRAHRCKEIFQLAESKDKKLAKLLSDATRCQCILTTAYFRLTAIQFFFLL